MVRAPCAVPQGGRRSFAGTEGRRRSPRRGLAPLVPCRMAITEGAVMDALATVQDPELHQDLVTLGMVESVAIDGDRVAVRIQLTTPACPMRARIETDVRQALAKVPGLAAVELSFGAQVRASPTGNMPGVKNVVAVGSG